MNKKLSKALDQISDNYLSEAENYKRPNRRPYWVAAIAAVLALVIGLSAAGGLFTPQPTNPVLQGTTPKDPVITGIEDPGSLNLANLVAAPVYPQMEQRPQQSDYPDYNAYNKAWNAWSDNQRLLYNAPKGYADSLTDFFLESTRQFLDPAKNSAFSPVNVYMALAMLAETTDGNSRQQILDAFGLSSIQQLRTQVQYLWKSHYCDDGVTTLLLGNSLWLDEAFSFHSETLQQLADLYYASSFWGDLGTAEMDQQLQSWLNANTGGLLQEQAENIKLDPSTIFALASTVYFAADWDAEFNPANTKDMVFHCENYDLMTPFMNQSIHYGTYYRGSNFGAIALGLNGNNDMWLILPDEGHTVAEILQSDEYLLLTTAPYRWENQKTYTIHLSLPKFDVASETDLAQGLQNMGITDVFRPTISDFTPLTDTPALYVGSASHAARVVIDEEGCLAAAFTVIATYATGAFTPPPEMDFVLDRPFLFVISSRDNLPLFVGTVVQP